MVKLKSLMAAGALATAALASGVASAADVSQGAQTLSLSNGTAFFGHSFTSGSIGDTFADKYSFSGTGVLSAFVGAFTAPNLADAIEITNFQVFNSAGFSLDGTQWSQGSLDNWTASSTGAIQNDSYYVLVTGKLLSAAATSYAGTVSVSAVPEPETFAMLAAGLGLIGFVSRRRNKDAKKLS
ncbi:MULTISPECIES: FxDxF family PEP-CTERM protein [unclassified Duganella]|uniref:FxDxF family PEP-CTERM protein n=1 Tax=unclassified Duganella TaxID=2636909 RepID=UPI00088F1742|nr:MULTISPECIES: FxDxF family PEP-CTERM protein [unclassified Duganella]SDH36559.1 PEP-CTERM protein-sorting domain-containing protein [Duganella sp. OV458]SDK52904.1 PEP-CTERM protein-sorting domain-containing protein [Duganella sp. OV510]